MKKSVYNHVLFILFLTAPSFLTAQGIDSEGKKSSHFPQTIHPGTLSIAHNFDVLHYTLNVSLGMTDSSFGGSMMMKILITDPADSLVVHSLGLNFTSITINDTNVSYSMYPVNESFTIHLMRTFQPAETVNVEIDYSRIVAFSRLQERQGYYWSAPRDSTVLEYIGYTMSEPYDARLWMPCYDDPSDKATCEIHVSVPDGFVAASNGNLDSIAQSSGTTTFHWSENYPIATYLMCITASKYSTFSHFYHKVTNPTDSVEVKYYMWRADSAGTKFNAVQAFSKVTQMMSVYSTIFGEYPFEKYGMAAAYPFNFGGMEHQTITTVHRAWISVSGYPYYEDGIAHELAHQWFGDLITCETFKDIWLNESFATYSEALWREKEYGIASYHQKMKNMLFFDGTWKYAIYDPLGQNQPLFGSAVYQKGAWVLHMLRYLIGDTNFFNILAAYRSNYAYSTATTADFNALVNSVTGQTYDWFFNQWIYGKGWPTFAYRLEFNETTSSYDLLVKQLQTQFPVFRVPLEIQVWYGETDTTYIFADSLDYQVFPLQANIDSIKFDPNNRIIKQVAAWPTGVGHTNEIPAKYELFQNYPNPFNPVTIVNFQLPIVNYVTLKVYNLLGQEVATLVNQVLQPGLHEVKWDASNVPSGVYFYRLQSGNFNETKKLVIIK